mmetsp:Transcript_22739/g.55308  ORF Transcript_22739/g.55308 Transcript_22739/m.55308 type:complete len:131 (+) Transcript_22739:93-485(+)
MKSSHGLRHRTRNLYKIKKRYFTRSSRLYSILFKKKDLCHLRINPSLQKGLPYKKLNGKSSVLIYNSGKQSFIKLYKRENGSIRNKKHLLDNTHIKLSCSLKTEEKISHENSFNNLNKDNCVLKQITRVR